MTADGKSRQRAQANFKNNLIEKKKHIPNGNCKDPFEAGETSKPEGNM